MHKLRNVKDKLPTRSPQWSNGRGAPPTAIRTRWPYKPLSSMLAKKLDRTHPGAAASFREGLAKTLTINRLNVPADPRPHVALDEPESRSRSAGTIRES